MPEYEKNPAIGSIIIALVGAILVGTFIYFAEFSDPPWPKTNIDGFCDACGEAIPGGGLQYTDSEGRELCWKHGPFRVW